MENILVILKYLGEEGKLRFRREQLINALFTVINSVILCQSKLVSCEEVRLLQVHVTCQHCPLSFAKVKLKYSHTHAHTHTKSGNCYIE